MMVNHEEYKAHKYNWENINDIKTPKRNRLKQHADQ